MAGVIAAYLATRRAADPFDPEEPLLKILGVPGVDSV